MEPTIEPSLSLASRPLSVVILDDQITHYRIPLFAYLATQSIRLTVLYSTHSIGSHEAPSLDQKLGFNYELARSYNLRLTKAQYGEPRNVLINPALFSQLVRLRPEVVVGYSFSVPTWIGFTYSRLFRRGFVSWSGDTLHTERHYGPIQRLSRRIIVPRAGACVALSHQAKEKFVSFGAHPERVKVSVQASGYKGSDPIETTDRAGIVAERDMKSILYVGGLSERKGVRQLLEIFANVQRQIQEARLVIVGDGPLRTSVGERIQELNLDGSVDMPGFVPPDSLGEYYERSGLFLFPTHEDTFGVVIAEAAAHGLPMIVSPYAGASDEFVRHGENGFIVDPNDVTAAAAAVISILSDDGLRAEMGRKSYEIANSYTLEDAGNQFIDAIELSVASAHDA